MVTTGSWAGYPFPPDVINNFLSKLLAGSPFANALSPQPLAPAVSSGRLSPPEGVAWLAETQLFPQANLNDEIYQVAVCKLGTIISLSNESVADSSLQHFGVVGWALADSCGPILDFSFIYGGGGLEPRGVWAAAGEAAEAPDFRAACILSWGELGCSRRSTREDHCLCPPHPNSERVGEDERQRDANSRRRPSRRLDPRPRDQRLAGTEAGRGPRARRRRLERVQGGAQ